MDLRSLKIALKAIFRLLQVNKVIVVDDAYERKLSVQEALAAVRGLTKTPDVLAKILHCGIDFQQPELVWKAALDKHWDGLDNDQRASALAMLYSAVGEDKTGSDILYSSTLKRLLDTAIQVEELTPAEWDAKKDHYLETAKSNSRLMILFDWDLEGRDGTELLKEAHKSFAPDCVILGLLSQEFKIGEERKIAKDRLDVPLSSCLPIAKERLVIDEGLGFAEGVKMAALNNTMDKLIAAVVTTLASAVQGARDQLRDLYPYDLVHVFEGAYSEGSWETESVFRLLDVYFRDNLREKAEKDPARSQFDALTTLVQELAKVAAGDMPELQPSDRVKEIRRRELYPRSDLHNQLLTPVRLGDIYEINRKPYILLAQPCDLMLRGGRRLTEVPLVEIRESKKDLDQDGPPLFGHLDYYCGDQRYYVAYKYFVFVPVELLDMTSYNEDGQCKIGLQADPPQGLNRRRAKQYRAVRKNMVSLAEILAAAEEHQKVEAREPIKKAILAPYCKGEIAPPNVTDQEVSFQTLKRVGHYREDMASYLLGAFWDVNSRPAKLSDFAAPKEPDPAKATGEA